MNGHDHFHAFHSSKTHTDYREDQDKIGCTRPEYLFFHGRTKVVYLQLFLNEIIILRKTRYTLILLLCTSFLNGQNVIYPEFFEPLYGFNLIEAEEELNNINVDIPVDDKQLLQVHLSWWKLIAGYHEVDKYLKNSVQFIEDHIKSLESQIEAKPTSIMKMKLLNLYLYKARIEFLGENYFSGLGGLRKCIALLEQCNNAPIQSKELEFVNALYDYYYDYGYENYFLLRPLLATYPDGTMEVGLNTLKKLTTSENWALAAESVYFLAKIYLESEDNATASLKYSKKLTAKYPHNYIFNIKLAKALKKLGGVTELESFCSLQIIDIASNKGLTGVSRKHFTAVFTEIMND